MSPSPEDEPSSSTSAVPPTSNNGATNNGNSSSGTVIPSGSSSVTSSAQANQFNDEIANGYRWVCQGSYGPWKSLKSENVLPGLWKLTNCEKSLKN